MLDSTSPQALHKLQNLGLICLSLAFLPINTYVVLASWVYTRLFGSHTDVDRRRSRNQSGFQQRTILVTGVGMTKGLALARLFYLAGYRVFGADFESNGTYCPGRYSRAIAVFRQLQKPSARHGSSKYVQGLLDVVLKENVDLWVSCSGVASAVEDAEAREIIEARTACRAIQFGVEATQTLHEKHTFIASVKKIGLRVPDTHTITSPTAVKSVLRDAPPGSKYIMKTIGMVDAVRADMTLLPKSTPQDTSSHIARLPISEDVPWILQQYIKGSEYCTHSLVIDGEVKAFLACPSAELLMHYRALAADSGLSQAMLEFTEAVARSWGKGFTGHLSFDFMVPDPEIGLELEKVPKDRIELYPIECNPRAHTAVALFSGTNRMAEAYLQAVQHTDNLGDVVTPLEKGKYRRW